MATRTIETNIILGGEKEFQAAMTAINSNLGVMKSEMSAVSAEYADNANSVSALTAKQKQLDAIAQQQAEKARILAERYDVVSKKYGENSAQADKARIAMNQATVASEKAAAAAERNADALSASKRDIKQWGAEILAAAQKLPGFGIASEVAEKAAKGLTTVAKQAAPALKGVGTAAAGIAKGVGLFSGAAAAGVAALGALGVVGITTMANFAKESAEAAKAAQEALAAGESLPEAQQKWLDFANQLDALDGSVAAAKSALGGVLLPLLSDLSAKGGALLDNFSKEMEAAAGDTGKQGEIMGRYIADGAKLILESLPEYIEVGKQLIGGLLDGLEEEGPAVLDVGADLVFDLLESIIEHAPELGMAAVTLIEKLTASLGERGPDLLTSAVKMVSEITTGLAQAAPRLIPVAGQLVIQLITALAEAAPDLLLAGLELILGIITGIVNGLGDIVNSAGLIIETLIDAFRERSDRISQVGSDIITEIRNGIAEAWGGLVTWFNNLWDSLFGNRSVSVSVNSSGGNSHATGLSYVPFDGYPAILHEGEMVLTRSQANLFRRGYKDGIRADGESGGAKAVNLYFYTKTITEAEINMICDVVNRKLGDDL